MSEHSPLETDAPRITVIVPTFNRVDRLQRVLQGLANQTVPTGSAEVIVVSDGSTDGTDDFMSGDELPVPVVYVRQPNSGPGAARNRGIERASAELVLFLDDDVVPAPELLEQHLDAQAANPGCVVVGPMLNPPDHPMSVWVQWEQTMLYKQYTDMDAGRYSATARQFYTGNASVPRVHLEACDGFDESLRRAEDVELAFRLDDLNIGFRYQRDARAFHYAERSYDSWSEIAYVYGRNDISFARGVGREWMAPFIVDTFRHHHPLVRWTTRLAIRSSRARQLMIGALRRFALWCEGRAPGWADPARIARPSLSIIHSIRYHEGVIDELGGRDGFYELLRSRQLDPTPAPA